MQNGKATLEQFIHKLPSKEQAIETINSLHVTTKPTELSALTTISQRMLVYSRLIAMAGQHFYPLTFNPDQ